MKIVVAGAGRVGFELARTLSIEHEITVIDRNAEALNRLGELIDVYPLVGDVENPQTYQSLLDTSVDVFIAVTDSDEANILAMLLANESLTITHRIIRLRNRYFETSRFLASLGDLERVFPYRLTAETVRLLLQFPGANNVKSFSATPTRLISVRADNPHHEHKSVGAFENDHLRIVGIERKRHFFIPRTDETVRHGDLIYFLGDEHVLDALYGQLDLHMPASIQNGVVFGADTLGIEIAQVLIDEGVEVKIIEKGLDRCHAAVHALQNRALVINSHYDEAILYEEEHLNLADIVIAAHARDEVNILQALQAREHAIPKIVAVNNERKYYPLMHQLGMVVSRGPRVSAYYAILEQLTHHEAIELRHFCGGDGVVIVRHIDAQSSLRNREIRIWKDEGIFAVERNGAFVALETLTHWHEGDVLFLIIPHSLESKAHQWITAR